MSHCTNRFSVILSGNNIMWCLSLQYEFLHTKRVILLAAQCFDPPGIPRANGVQQSVDGLPNLLGLLGRKPVFQFIQRIFAEGYQFAGAQALVQQPSNTLQTAQLNSE